MNNRTRVLLSVAAAAALCLVLFGCAGGSSPNTLSGKIIDAVSGQPVGGTIYFGGYKFIAGPPGTFKMDLSSNSGTETGAFHVGAAGYGGMYIEGMTLDRSKSTSIVVPLNPLNASGYSTHAITGKIFDGLGVEVTPTTQVDWQVLSRTGSRDSGTFGYTSPYVINTREFESDCLVAITVAGSYTIIVSGVNLAASSTTLNLTEDTVHTISVAVTAGAVNNTGSFYFTSPYGAFKVWDYDFSASPPNTTAKIANPYGYQGYWVQKAEASDTPSLGYTKQWCSTSTLGPVTSSVVLPALNSGLGPTSGSPAAGFSYSGGVLSVPPATGASFYQFTIGENASPPSCGAFLLASGPSVSLPSWMRSQFSGKSVKVSLWVIGSDSPFFTGMSLDQMMTSMGTSGLSPGVQFSSVNGSSAILSF